MVTNLSTTGETIVMIHRQGTETACRDAWFLDCQFANSLILSFSEEEAN